MLQASAGWVDLAPHPNSWLTGFCARIEPATEQHDPITARAVVLEDDGVAIAIVACDLVGFSPADSNDMRRKIAERSAIPAANILISCSHTHTGPACLDFRGVMGHVDKAWLSSTFEKIVELVVRVAAGLNPAKIAHASTTVQRVGHNRQDRSRSFDETLQVVGVNDLAGEPIATLFNYATHPVTLGPVRVMSADFPGELCRTAESLRGGTALFLQGACGDVNPFVYIEPSGRSSFENIAAIGRQLADAGLAALERTEWKTSAAIRVKTSQVEIPLASPPTLEQLEVEMAQMEKVREEQAAKGQRQQELATLAMLDWAREIQGAIRKGHVPGSMPAELFMATVGDLRIAGVPFETYSDIALRVKEALQPHPVLFCGYANGVIGYCPTKLALDQGGYGPSTSYRWFPHLLTPISYGADDRIVAEAERLGRELDA